MKHVIDHEIFIFENSTCLKYQLFRRLVNCYALRYKVSCLVFPFVRFFFISQCYEYYAEQKENAKLFASHEVEIARNNCWSAEEW